ncbi:MAG: efflux RND transporter periplasmic adaptor subunit [Colwellia sp.]|nr:efflux RND transporter periplasmic adaptor subunit [Colwellia sp.]
MTNDNPITSRLPLFIILSLLVGLVIYLQWPEAEQHKKKFQRIVPVKTTTVKLAEFKDSIEAIGTARANEQVLITSKYSDFVDEVFFNDGQLVKKGDVLIHLNNQEELAKVSELKANLSESMAQLQRFQELLSSKATSKSLVDEQEAKTKAIAAQLQSARIKLNDLNIKAPFDGVLGFREVSVGAYINAGSIITSLDDFSLIKVDFTLPERFLPTIIKGQSIIAHNSAYKNQPFMGTISSIDSRINPVTRTLKVRAEIPNNNLALRPGMLLNIQVLRQVETLLQLPESTIIPIEDKHFVFVISRDKNEALIAVRKSITIGRRLPGVVEVLGGINNDEQVVTEGALKLRDGAKVKVLNQVATPPLGSEN